LAGPDNCPYLLAGLSDGTVATFAFRNKKFQEEKITSLGDSPVSLTACEVEGRRTVFACGSRVSIFCWEKKRLHQSSLLLKVHSSLVLPTISLILL
jgi:DNA damage-binding protein 1